MVFDLSIFNQISGNIYASKPLTQKRDQLQRVKTGSLFQNPLDKRPDSLIPVMPQQPAQDLFLKRTCDIGSIANSMIKIIDAKDSYTGSHCKAVQSYARLFSKSLGLSGDEVEKIAVGSAFHDIGKIGVPEEVLNNNGPLSDGQFAKIKQHPEIGYKILEDMPAFKGSVAKIVRHHHESWDGSGYPHNLSGDKIPLGARIVAVVDSYHAMTSNRPYRKGMPTEKALGLLKDGAGIQWDPTLIKEFSKIIHMV